MEDKYRDLVWYVRHMVRQSDEAARAEVREDIRTAAKKAAVRIENEYPEETETLWNEEVGEWTHGFNSSVLQLTPGIATSLK